MSDIDAVIKAIRKPQHCGEHPDSYNAGWVDGYNQALKDVVEAIEKKVASNGN